MAGFGGGHEKSRCPGRGQRGRDLVANVSRFAHTRDDNAAARVHAKLAGRDEIVIQPRLELLDRSGFDFQYLGGQRE